MPTTNGHQPMNSTGHQPMERPTDRFAEEMLRPLIAHEVARQLAVPQASAEPLWIHRGRLVLMYLAMLSLIVIAALAVAGVLR